MTPYARAALPNVFEALPPQPGAWDVLWKTATDWHRLAHPAGERLLSARASAGCPHRGPADGTAYPQTAGAWRIRLDHLHNVWRWSEVEMIRGVNSFSVCQISLRAVRLNVDLFCVLNPVLIQLLSPEYENALIFPSSKTSFGTSQLPQFL